VIINGLLPDVVITVVITLVLLYSTYETTMKGRELFKKETATNEPNTDVKKEKSDQVENSLLDIEMINYEDKVIGKVEEEEERTKFAQLAMKESNELNQWRMHFMNLLLVSSTFLVK
jgi:hypothetical protein